MFGWSDTSGKALCSSSEILTLKSYTGRMADYHPGKPLIHNMSPEEVYDAIEYLMML